MKYDKIVEISKERSRQNTEVALRAIEGMDYRCRACQENKIIKSKFLCE